MSRSGVAARRFYHAFYQWALLAEASQPCTRALSTSAPSCPPRVRRNGGSRTHQEIPNVARTTRWSSSAAPGKEPALDSGDTGLVKPVASVAVCSAQERPFNDMRIWEEAVRVKSFAGNSIEICVPDEALAELEQRRGALASLEGLQALQIQIGDIETHSRQPLSVRSVMATGASEDIDVLRNIFRPLHKKEFGRKNHETDHEIYSLEAILECKLPAKLRGRMRWDDQLKLDLKNVRGRINCSIDDHTTPLVRFRGQRSAIEAAKTAMQVVYDEACVRQSIPRRIIKDVVPMKKSSVCPETMNERQKRHIAERTKAMLRHLTHPVVLVTAWDKSTAWTKEKLLDPLRGVTISSLTSVSMHPAAVVSFNLSLSSRTWQAIRETGNIGINFLSASVQGAAIAEAFTRPYKNPSEPFYRVQQLGCSFVNSHGKTSLLITPTDDDSADPAFFGGIRAHVMPEKCVEVGDHVIVVAQVSNVMVSKGVGEALESGNVSILAYANRAFRTTGQVIEPTPIPEKDGLQQVCDRAKEGGDGRTFATKEKEVESLFGASDFTGHLSDDVDAGPETLHSDQSNLEEPDTPSKLREEDSFPEAIAPITDETVTSPDIPNVAQTQTIPQQKFADHRSEIDYSEPHRPVCYVQGRPFGPLSGSLSSPPPHAFSRHPSRNYSTSAIPPTPPADLSKASPAAGTTPSASSLVDPSIASKTVREFLNSHDDESYRLRRMRALMKARRKAHDASRQLEFALRNGTLTAQESERLEDIITRNERWVAKKLALHAAYDLRLMLDKGRVDVKLAQWLESSIEKGQAVLMEEAKEMRALFDSGKVDAERFRVAKEHLEQDNQTLATEAMRLRQMVDEEGDDGDALVEQRKGFDGFSGNV